MLSAPLHHHVPSLITGHFSVAFQKVIAEMSIQKSIYQSSVETLIYPPASGRLNQFPTPKASLSVRHSDLHYPKVWLFGALNFIHYIDSCFHLYYRRWPEFYFYLLYVPLLVIPHRLVLAVPDFQNALLSVLRPTKSKTFIHAFVL